MAIRFTSILRDIILENTRNTILFDKYVKPGKDRKSIMTIQTLFDIIAADPTSRVPEGMDSDNLKPEDIEKVKIGKYTQWILKNYVTPNVLPSIYSDPNSPAVKRAIEQSQLLFMEDLYKITDDLMKFERFKNRLPQEARDINKLTPETLYDQVKDFSLEKTRATKDEKREASRTYEHPGGEVVYRGSEWTVVRISDQGELGKNAACFYGGQHKDVQNGETRWCTSSPGLTYFNTYIKQGPLYVLIPNSPRPFTGSMDIGLESGLPAYRLQFHFPSNQYMTPDDRNINLVDFLNENEPGLKAFFKPEFAKGLASQSLVSQDNLVSITYPDGSAASKFIGLYGFDDLYTMLPKNIRRFSFLNVGKESFNLPIPDDIGDYTSLIGLHLSNCVTNLPDSVCKIKNLKFLSITDSPNLQSIPECLVDSPQLTIVVLKNSRTEGVVPESFKQRNETDDHFHLYLN